MSTSVLAGDVDNIHVLKISPQDQRAVVKMPDGKVRVIKTGEILHVAGDELRVAEISEGRVVFEEKKGDETETVIIRLENGKQRVERMRKTGEKRPQLYAPAVNTTKK